MNNTIELTCSNCDYKETVHVFNGCFVSTPHICWNWKNKNIEPIVVDETMPELFFWSSALFSQPDEGQTVKVQYKTFEVDEMKYTAAKKEWFIKNVQCWLRKYEIKSGFLIRKGDEVNSFLIAALRSLNQEQLIVLRDNLISRTPLAEDSVEEEYWEEIIKTVLSSSPQKWDGRISGLKNKFSIKKKK